jgi:spore maturation protein A
MLNYIWAGLIIISVVFALWQDGSDFKDDRYRNGETLSVLIEGLPPGYADLQDPGPVDVSVKINTADYLSFFDPTGNLGLAADSEESAKVRSEAEAFFAEPLPAKLVTTDRGRELQLAVPDALPTPLDVIYESTKNDSDLLPTYMNAWELDDANPSQMTASIKFGHVGFVKVREVTATMFDQSGNAVTFAIGLMGVIALWMGLMKIAEDAGLVAAFVKIVRPVLGPLFPQIPKDHPALGLIAVNLAANMLALGNAATPLGIKAMESLQELNKEKDTATDSMVMLLAMNTASVQLLPPVTLIAIMGLAATDLFIPIFLVTLVSLGIAITAAKMLGRMKMFRKTDPMRPDNPNAEKGGAA